MVFGGRQPPLTEPALQRGDETTTLRRMLAQDLPLVVGELVGGVQDLGRHGQLADVVRHRSPMEKLTVGGIEAHLLADEIGVGPYPFGVASGHPVVASEVGQHGNE